MARLDLLLGKMIEDTPKRRKTKRLPEKQIEDEIDSFLKASNIYARVIKSDGQFRNGRWMPSRQGKGISDRIAILSPSGRFLAIEVKATGKKKTATTEQIDFLTRIIQSGGIGVVADSVECVKAALLMSKEQLLAALPEIKTESDPVNLEPLFP